MHHASVIGRVDLVQLLVVEGGAEVNAVDDYGETALHKACMRGWEGLVKQLLTHPNIHINASESFG